MPSSTSDDGLNPVRALLKVIKKICKLDFYTSVTKYIKPVLE